MKTLSVNLPALSYPIHIGAGLLESSLTELLAPLRPDRIVVVTNDRLQSLYPDRIAKALISGDWRVDTFTVPDGEQFKTLDTLSGLYDRMMDLGASRKTVAVAFGGGVIGDMAGYMAATFMRGIPLIQVPTTLLSQVDSSVGGKTAVNHPRGKNIIGAFKQPAGVVIDLEFLATLPDRELRAGLFELIKHGIIREPGLFDFLESQQEAFTTQDWAFWEEAVYRSCQVKAEVVESDEREEDLRAILNFGHSLAHLIETHTGYVKYLHGEAVGVGMIFAAELSHRWGHLAESDLLRIRDLLEPLLNPIVMPPMNAREFQGLLLHDKKAAGDGLRFILLNALGRAFIRENTTAGEIWPVFLDFLSASPHILRLAA